VTQSVSQFPWPGAALTTVAIGIALLAAPAGIEGPILLPISPGHALSALDSVALIPLLAGTWSLYAGLWRRRAGLRRLAQDAPGPAGAAVFVAGFGLGLLIASAFSAFFWWWAVGAVLFGALLLAAVLAVSGRSGDGASRP
jgi:hypothetical protein